MTRTQIELQARLARQLNDEPNKYCTSCTGVLLGLEKLGAVCNRCLSDRAANREYNAVVADRPWVEFYDALEAMENPSPTDVCIAHALGVEL